MVTTRSGNRALGSRAGNRGRGSRAGNRGRGSRAGNRGRGSRAGNRGRGSRAGNRGRGSTIENPIAQENNESSVASNQHQRRELTEEERIQMSAIHDTRSGQLRRQRGENENNVRQLVQEAELVFTPSDDFIATLTEAATSTGYNAFLTSILYLLSIILNWYSENGGLSFTAAHYAVDVGLIEKNRRYVLLPDGEREDNCPRLKFVASQWEQVVQNLLKARYNLANIPPKADTLIRYFRAHMRVVRFYAMRVEPPPGMTFLDFEEGTEPYLRLATTDERTRSGQWAERMVAFITTLFGPCTIGSVKENAMKDVDKFAGRQRKMIIREMIEEQERVIRLNPLIQTFTAKQISAEFRRQLASTWVEANGRPGKVYENIRIENVTESVAEHTDLLLSFLPEDPEEADNKGFGLLESISMYAFVAPKGSITVDDARHLLQVVLYYRKEVLGLFSVVFKLTDDADVPSLSAVFKPLIKTGKKGKRKGSISFTYEPSEAARNNRHESALWAFQDKVLAAWLVETARARGYVFEGYVAAKREASQRLPTWMGLRGSDRATIFGDVFVQPFFAEDTDTGPAEDTDTIPGLKYETIAKSITKKVTEGEGLLTNRLSEVIVQSTKLLRTVQDSIATLTLESISFDPTEGASSVFAELYWHYSGRGVQGYIFAMKDHEEANGFFAKEGFWSSLSQLLEQTPPVLRLQCSLFIPATEDIIKFLMTDESLVEVRGEVQVSLWDYDFGIKQAPRMASPDVSRVARWWSEEEASISSYPFLEIKRVEKGSGTLLGKAPDDIDRYMTQARGLQVDPPPGDKDTAKENAGTEDTDEASGSKESVDSRQKASDDMGKDAIGTVTCSDETCTATFRDESTLEMFVDRLQAQPELRLCVRGEQEPRKVVFPLNAFPRFPKETNIVSKEVVLDKLSEYGTVKGFDMAGCNYVVQRIDPSDSLAHETTIYHWDAYKPDFWLGDTVYAMDEEDNEHKGTVRGFYSRGGRDNRGYWVKDEAEESDDCDFWPVKCVSGTSHQRKKEENDESEREENESGREENESGREENESGKTRVGGGEHKEDDSMGSKNSQIDMLVTNIFSPQGDQSQKSKKRKLEETAADSTKVPQVTPGDNDKRSADTQSRNTFLPFNAPKFLWRH